MSATQRAPTPEDVRSLRGVAGGPPPLPGGITWVHAAWTPVDERLPPYEQHVLVVDAGGDICVCVRESTDKDGEHWFVAHSDREDGDDFTEITHWMPLPAPPFDPPPPKGDSR